MSWMQRAACVAGVVAVVMAGGARAAGGDIPLLAAKVELGDRASLQRGAKLFVNYCASCHSAKFLRYSQMGRDLGITEEQLRANLMFSSDKPGDPIRATLSDADAGAWFGQLPPDLSLTARARGADWIYTYLMTFYRDEDRPSGPTTSCFPMLQCRTFSSICRGCRFEGRPGKRTDAAPPERAPWTFSSSRSPAP